MHMFRDCINSFSTWSCLSYQKPRKFFSETEWKNWLSLNLNSTDTWSIVFGVTLDQLWRNQNNWIFNQKATSTYSSIATISHQVEWIINVNNKIRPGKLVETSCENQRRWNPPPKGLWKLNCDGSVTNHGQSAGCGGILRNSSGNFVFAFTHRLNGCFALEAELWGIYHGLCFAWNKGYKKVIVACDSTVAIDLLFDRNVINHPHQQMLNSIRNIGEGEAIWLWQKIERQLNCVADTLAKYCSQLDIDCKVFDLPPDFLFLALNLDRVGLGASGL